MSTRLCLIRHGETQWNATQRIQGQRDVELNALGKAQARAMAEYLAHYPFDALYSSDLVRTRQTAAVLSDQLTQPVILQSELRERHLGVFQGLTREQARQQYPELYSQHQQRTLDNSLISGESLRHFNQRIIHALQHMIQQHPEQTLAVITHGGVLDCIYRQANQLPLSDARHFAIPNCGINWLQCQQQDWKVRQWADITHLIKITTHNLESPDS